MGDVTILNGVLRRPGAQVGTSNTVCTATSTSGQQVQCHGTLTLTKGTLIDVGNVDFSGGPRPVSFGIVGGTGAYDDNHGQVVAMPGPASADTLEIDID
jgi:hypothetical protein